MSFLLRLSAGSHGIVTDRRPQNYCLDCPVDRPSVGLALVNPPLFRLPPKMMAVSQVSKSGVKPPPHVLLRSLGGVVVIRQEVVGRDNYLVHSL